jgi:hypothetical protein
MDHRKSSGLFTKRYCSSKCFFLMVGLLGIFLFSISGIVYAQYQMKAPQISSKGGEAYIKVTSPAENEVWEKGKRYTIKWESKSILGNVKILLISEGRKPIEISRSTENSNSYNYVVPRTLGEGTYRIQVAKIDESVKGESAALTIKGQTLGISKGAPQTGQPSSGLSKSGAQTGTAPTGSTAGTKTAQVAAAPSAATALSAGATPSTGATPSAGTSASTGVTSSTTSTPIKGVTSSLGITGKTPTAAEKVGKQQVTAVKVSEAELKNLPVQKSAASATNLKIGGQSTAGEKIEVTSPKDGEVWEADKEYLIQWKGTDITGDVKIVLEKITIYAGGKQSVEEHPIIDRTANTGSYRFRVPVNLVLDPYSYHVRVGTLDGKVSGKSRGAITVNTQYVDLECKIMNAYRKSLRLHASVWWRNNGTRCPIEIWPVLVRVIKEPEELVVAQEEWGVSQVYPRAWYKLEYPRTFLVQSWTRTNFGKPVDYTKGAYRIEVELDTQNRLGENQRLRDNNKDVARINIGSGGK